MAYAFVVGTKAASSDTFSALTPAVDTTAVGANGLIAIFVSNYQPGPDNTLYDSNLNTWVPRTAYENAGANRGRWYYCQNPTVGAVHTFGLATTAPSVSYPTLLVLCFSGSVASPADQENADINGGGGVTASNTGSVTPSENNELLLAGIAWYNSPSSVSIDSSFTGLDTILTSSTNIPGGVAYKIQTSAGAENPQFSWSGSSIAIGVIETFKAGGAGGAAPVLAGSLLPMFR